MKRFKETTREQTRDTEIERYRLEEGVDIKHGSMIWVVLDIGAKEIKELQEMANELMDQLSEDVGAPIE